MSFFGISRRLFNIAVNNPKTKGATGEVRVMMQFHPNVFGNDERYIINSLHFPNGEHVYQIDNVVIYKTGIFCIETKNYRGKIIGRQNDTNWTVFSNGQKYDMYSPIRQNEKHVQMLSELLNNEYDIVNVVVFVNGNKPKDIDNNVLNLDELAHFVKTYKGSQTLDSTRMQEIFNKLVEHKRNN